jgi:hypothetical protein
VSRAFPNLEVIFACIHRAPFADHWLSEFEAYRLYPAITPEFVSQAYYAGRLLVWREIPAEVAWLRPTDDDWARLAKDARDGRVVT